MTSPIKVALVTGASGALGSAVVMHLLDQGYQVVALERRPEKIQERFGDANARLLALACDVTDTASCKAACAEATQRFGRIDVLCNIAGGFSMGPSIAEDAIAQYEHLMALNAGSVFKMMHCVVPTMVAQRAGSIVNVGAQSALTGQASMTAYCASKSAVIRMTESFAAEFKSQGVRVNCVLPRTIDTPQNRKDMPDADFTQWTSPEKIAQTMGFLASEQSAAVNGASVAV
ncbi:SDR family NAD(P)-dependent oxidoreductase [Diaphorobacter aerolatus]|uniref:SDR family oxidoreductase n=1 Tax=Diaphorobacter aerolatus TaxID=1288495 RepID=A0A7H0GI25_9BURK|nr:SDR family NAD(P)-dependent oxidoreductase [Diaphorobacter aerolatus]QNP47941.1 SDR family oxidoreductase [Diaphorobacter aerolatus]